MSVREVERREQGTVRTKLVDRDEPTNEKGEGNE